MLIINLVDGADVRMVQGGRSFRFALEAGEGLRVFCNVVGQEFERNEAAELHIFGFVDNTHAATAQLLDDAVVRDGLADHVRRRSYVGNRQVNESGGVGCDPLGSIGVTVRRERRWTTAGATPARELVRSTR